MLDVGPTKVPTVSALESRDDPLDSCQPVRNISTTSKLAIAPHGAYANESDESNNGFGVKLGLGDVMRLSKVDL